MRRYYHKPHAPDPRQRHPRARSVFPAFRDIRHSRGLKACPVPRYGARIHALTPRGKMSIANPGTTNAVNVARGLVPRYGVPPTGNPLRRTIRPTTPHQRSP